MMSEMRETLDYIISNKEIKSVFQPIISLQDGEILGHEALSRITCKGAIEHPEMLFCIAGEYGRLWDLEQLCRTVVQNKSFFRLMMNRG